MQIRFVTISAGALVLAATSPALSHHPSGTGTSSTGGPIVTIPGTTLQQGKGAFYLVFEHYSFDELSDTVLEGAAARDEHTHSLATLESAALGYSYGLTDRLMVSVLLPYVVRTGIREAHHHHEEPAAGHGETPHAVPEAVNETVDRGDTDGVGDLSLFGQYRFYGQDAGLQASFLAGIKTPTGETGEHDDQGELFEAEFQPGSGSWDPMLGLALSRAQGRWSIDGNVLYTLATEGTQHTDLGDRFHYNGAVTYRLKGGDAEASHEVKAHHSHPGRSHHHEHGSSPKGLVIDAVLELNGEWHEANHQRCDRSELRRQCRLSIAGDEDRLKSLVRIRHGRPPDHQRSERPAIGAELSTVRRRSSRLLKLSMACSGRFSWLTIWLTRRIAVEATR